MRPAPTAQQRAAVDARGDVFVAAGAGTGKTAVLVERFVSGGCRRRARRRLAPRHHVHRASGGRAAGADPVAAPRARAPGPRPPARRSVGLDDPRLLSPGAGDVPAPGGRRSGLPGPRRASGARAPSGGLRDRARAVLRSRRARSVAAARDVRGCRPPADARRGVRDVALGGA